MAGILPLGMKARVGAAVRAPTSALLMKVLILSWAALTAAQLVAPQNVSIVTTPPPTRFNWVQGLVNVSWSPVSYGVSGYRVSVDPLYGWRETFAQDATSPATAPLESTWRDYIVEPGKSSNTIQVRNGVLQLWLDDGSWVNTTGNLNTAPATFRRIPEGIATASSSSFIQVDVNCSGAPNVQTVPASTPAVMACGIVVWNAANKMPLLFWGLKRSNAVGATWQVVMDGLRDNMYAFPSAAVGRAWDPSATSLFLQRYPPNTPTQPFFLAAKLTSDATPWSSVLARQNVPSTALDPSQVPGAHWFGVTAKATAVSPSSAISQQYFVQRPRRGMAAFDNLMVGMTTPTSMPRDIYGNVDVCAAAGLTRPISVTATAGPTTFSALLTGLSVNFPYTVTVTAVAAGSGTVSLPSPPLENLFFYARRMPPRQQKLRLWLDTKYLPSGAVSSFPDASGQAHHVFNNGPTSQRPSNIRTGGWGGNFLTPGYLRFSRSSSQYLVGDADAYHFSADSPMTVYWIARNRQTPSQVLIGRGAMASRPSSVDPGWVLAISSLTTDTYTGFVSMRVGSYVSPMQYDLPTAASKVNVAAAQVRSSTYYGGSSNYFGVFSGSVSRVPLNTTADAPSAFARVIDLNADPSRRDWVPRDYNWSVYPTIGELGLHRVRACNNPGCNSGTEGPYYDEFNEAFSNTYMTDSMAVKYLNTTPATQRFFAVPDATTLGRDEPLRLGGQPYGSNILTAYDGDVYGVAIYAEEHDTATRQALTDFYFREIEGAQCPFPLQTPVVTTSGSLAECRDGPAWASCFQDCAWNTPGGWVNGFLGSGGWHYCSNGQWTAPPLVCGQICNDVLAPIYYATCWRRYIDERFNLTAESWLEAKYWVFPTGPIVERRRTFIVDPVNMWLVATTKTADSCDRIRSGYYLYTPHFNRWNTYIPPANNLGMRVRALISWDDPLSNLGLAIRATGESNHYRAEMTPTQVQLVRLVNGVRTVLATGRHNVTIVPGQWYPFTIFAKERLIQLYYNWDAAEVLLLSVLEPTLFNAWGSGGAVVASASSGRFDNMTIDTECDWGVARWMYGGMNLFFTCKPGYAVIGNTTWTCNNPTTQYNGASLICLSKPPIPEIFTMSIPERSPNNTYAGIAYATPANGEQTLSYEQVRQFPPSPNGRFAFLLSSCSGSLRVQDPTQLDFQRNPNITVTLFVWPDTQRIAGVFWNVTIQLINIPDYPTIEPQAVSIREGFCGPANYTIAVTNIDRMRLRFSMLSGNSDGMFLLNSSTGALSINCNVRRCPSPIPPSQCPQGLNYAFKDTYTLTVQVIGDDISGGSADVTINVIDTNTAPVVVGSVITAEVKEDKLVPDMPFLTVSAFDMDALTLSNSTTVATWASLNYSITSNAVWQDPYNASRIYTNLLNMTRDGAVSLSTTALPPGGLPMPDFFFYNRRLIRGVMAATFVARDGGGLSTTGRVEVVVLSANDTGVFPQVDRIDYVGMPATQDGLSTTGGETIVFIGSNMPPGGVVTAEFYTPDGVKRSLLACVVSSEVQATCKSPPGFGRGLPFNLTIGNRLPNVSVPQEINYAPPTLDRIIVYNPSALSTSGSASGAFVTLVGSNFGPSSALGSLGIRFGFPAANPGDAPGGQFDMQPLAMGHTMINATVGAGCGRNLQITVIVAGQNSSAAYLDFLHGYVPPSADDGNGGVGGGDGGDIFGNGAGSGTGATGSGTSSSGIQPATVPVVTISYPPPAVTSMTIPSGASYTATTLGTLGGQLVRLKGTNFGPAAIRGASRSIRTYYSDAAGVFSYSMACTPNPLAPHTDMDCTTSPGVGAGHRFSPDICGQRAPPSPFDAAYAPPVLKDVAGPGAFRASTEGAQRVILRGENFGPVSRLGDVPQAVTGVFYGREEAGQPVYQAVDCYVSSATDLPGVNSEITCLTAPGTGDKLVYRVAIGFQRSAPVDLGTGYGSPIISFFTGPGAVDADTRAGSGYKVTINGLNFGTDNRLISASYRSRLSIPRASDGIVPSRNAADLAGVVDYTPAACALLTAHRVIECELEPGAGANLVWRLVVDRQASTDSVTSYGKPVITGVWFADVNASVASADGGDVVNITGVNFGPDGSLIQSLTYGPSGNEFAVRSWTYYNHTQLQAVLTAGVGANLSFVVTVADQISLPYRSSISYSGPRIVSIWPRVTTTAMEPGRPVLVTISGYDFGLLNPNVEVEIAMGNYEDSSVIRLPMYTRYPSLGDVVDPAWTPPPAPWLQSVSFMAPEGLSANRTVRLIQYLRGRKLGDGPVRRVGQQADGAPWTATFEYLPPYLTYSIVRAVNDEPTCNIIKNAFLQAGLSAGYTLDQLTTLSPDGSGAPSFDLVNCSTSRILELVGFNLGASPQLHNDGVQRLVQWYDASGGPGADPWFPRPRPYDGSDALAGPGWLAQSYGNSSIGRGRTVILPRLISAVHNQTRVVAYSATTAGIVRLNIAGAIWGGGLVQQASNELPFAETSPVVSAVTGQIDGGFPSDGYQRLLDAGLAPNTIRVTVSELLQFARLRIMVGEGLDQEECPILSDPFNPASIVRSTDIYTRIVFPITEGGAGAVTFTCLVPQGQGLRQPVTVVRDVTTSNADFFIDFAPPSLLATGLIFPRATPAEIAAQGPPTHATRGGVIMRIFPDVTAVSVPTTFARMRVQVRNIGRCPSIRVSNGAGITTIAACRWVPDPLVGRVRANNSAMTIDYDLVTRSFTVDFNVTDGEGTGVTSGNAIGWSIVIEAGNQDTASSGGIVRLRYLPPVVVGISPSGGPSVGSSAGAPYPLVITGANFGTGMFTGAVIGVQLVSPYRTNPLTCGSVVWLSHFAVQCQLPAGSGYHLRARVTVAGQSGEGGAFNYSAPALSRITFLAPDLLLEALRPGSVPFLYRAMLVGNESAGENITTVMLRRDSTQLDTPIPAGTHARLAALPLSVWKRLPVDAAALTSGSGGAWAAAAALNASLPALNASVVAFLQSNAAAGALAVGNGTLFVADEASGRRLLHWRASGGAVVVVDGSNFGPGGTRDDCVLVSPRESVEQTIGPQLSDGDMVSIIIGRNESVESVHVASMTANPALMAHTASMGVPRCNGFLDFMGEGELPPSSLLFWSHSRVVFLLPPGAGYRTITVAAGSQPPLPPAQAAVAALALPNAGVGVTTITASQYNMRFQQPQLVLPLVRRSGQISTDGGDLLEVLGFSLPFASTALGRDPAAAPLVLLPSNISEATQGTPAPNVNSSSLLQGRSAGYTGSGALPFALPPPAFTMPPWENVRITFGNATLNGTCLATPGVSYFNSRVPRPPGFERCVLNRVVYQGPSGSPNNPYTNDEYRRILVEQQSQLQALGSGASTSASSTSGSATGASASAGEAAYMSLLAAFNPNATGYVDVLTFLTPPGVGVNKSLNIEILDAAGNVVAAAPPTVVSYDPPAVSTVESATGSRIIYDDGNGGVAIRIRGKNMGRFRDFPFYSPDEQLLEVSIGGWLAVNATRQERATGNTNGGEAIEDYVGFTLPPASPAGFSEIVMKVAGQLAVSVPRSSASLFIGCKFGFFAHSNESCALCPEGANCTGLAGPMLTYPNGRTELDVNFNSPVPVPHPYLKEPGSKTTPLDLRRLGNHSIMVGDVEVDILGYHTYPVPASGFFNLNSTMRAACPEKVFNYFPFRDVCIVACIPTYACEGANICNEAYISKSPYFRCSSCAPGYFRSAGDCIKCPDNPGMVFVGFGMVILTVAGLGYFLNKYNYDTRVVAVGIDYFQVLAIFANAKVAWPPQIKELFRILSAFNLNLEIVAPECLVPDVSFEQKYFVVLMLPFVILFLFFTISVVRFLFARYCKGQKDWRTHVRNIAGSVSVLMLMLFLIYLYFCKTVLSPFECQPATPDDGKTYMQAVFEECGKPGGVQMRLVPWSVFAIIFVVLGYPAFVFAMLRYNKETVMEDQLLRALEMEPAKEDWASTMRAMMARTYYQFQPKYYLWTTLIIGRKFFIAFSSLMFSRNPAFQMAFCLLILYGAFASQVRFSPFMPSSYFTPVLEEAARLSMKQPLWARLKARVLSVDERVHRKKGFRNKLEGGGAGVRGGLFKSKGLNRLVIFLTDYNTVDAFLLFSASMVCLLGIMYETLQAKVSGVVEGYYKDTRFGITVLLMLLISVSIAYYVAVLLLDFMSQNADRKAKKASVDSTAAIEARAKVKRKTMAAAAAAKAAAASGESKARPDGRRRVAPSPAARRAAAEATKATGIEIFRATVEKSEDTQTNPLFMTGGFNLEALAEADAAAAAEDSKEDPSSAGVGAGTPGARRKKAPRKSIAVVLRQQRDVPTPGLWMVFRKQMLTGLRQAEVMATAVDAQKGGNSKLQAALQAAGIMNEKGEWLKKQYAPKKADSSGGESPSASGGAGAGSESPELTVRARPKDDDDVIDGAAAMKATARVVERSKTGFAPSRSET